MSNTFFVDDNPQTEDQLLIFLRKKNYDLLIRFFETNYRFNFHTEQSGESFENCINWCAQNAGNLQNAKEVVLRLFIRFYHQLPSPVRENLEYLAEEVGYTRTGPNLSKLKDRSKELAVATKTAYNVMVKQVQDYMAELRQRREPQVTVQFHQASIPASMMAHPDEQFLMDVRKDAKTSDPRERVSSSQDDLRLSA